ncbi:hypothetical protein TPA0909_56060 [Streptomyces albus]|nr:hypothetical protein TPA0909_56060 [Streptomyces albus]
MLEQDALLPLRSGLAHPGARPLRRGHRRARVRRRPLLCLVLRVSLLPFLFPGSGTGP